MRYVDPDGRAHFGKRPMKVFHNYWGIGASNPIDNLTNTELSHEHLFFDDEQGGNLGFSWEGLFEEPKENYDEYYMDKNQYDDDLIREAIKNVEVGEYSVIGSKIGKLIQNIAKLFGKIKCFLAKIYKNLKNCAILLLNERIVLLICDIFVYLKQKSCHSKSSN